MGIESQQTTISGLAESKNKLFITTPEPPYKQGDMWSDNGVVKKCINSKNLGGVFSATDFETLGYQNKNIILKDVYVDNWAVSATYKDYGFVSVITAEGCNLEDTAIVVYNVDESDSGNYASICETDKDSIKIYSKVDTAITIPTIEIHKY